MIKETELLHRQSSRHRPAIDKSRLCGCFHKSGHVPARPDTTWRSEPAVGEQPAGETAVCPKCGGDAVLPEWNEVYPMSP